MGALELELQVADELLALGQALLHLAALALQGLARGHEVLRQLVHGAPERHELLGQHGRIGGQGQGRATRRVERQRTPLDIRPLLGITARLRRTLRVLSRWRRQAGWAGAC